MDKLKTVIIKNRPYVEVNERIKYFREHYKNGQIITDLVSLENGVCVIRAVVYVDALIVATGHAYEKEGSTFINKTSYIENCETSAIGRALGIFGIGIDASVASAEEVKNAIHQQESSVLTPKQISDKLLQLDNKKVDAILKKYNVEMVGSLADNDLEDIAKKMKWI